jgi:hypothetical protein
MATHIFSWNLEGTLLRDVAPMDLWLPYDPNIIMRRGHEVNTSIPEYPAEAEFPDLPWGDEVAILIKSQSSSPAPSAPIPTGGPPDIPPSTWIGPVLGTAPPIDPDAAALTTYVSPNTGQDGTTLGDLPPDPSLLQFRGMSGADEIVHKMISWTTRKDYPVLIGISLPIDDMSYDRAHEGQLWEAVDTELIVGENHAEFVYTWLKNRFASRSMHQLLPPGMTEEFQGWSVSTWKDGKAGYILFSDPEAIMTMMSDSETQVLVEYENGYMREGIGNTYTIQVLYEDSEFISTGSWDIYPALAYRRTNDGIIIHNCCNDFRAAQILRSEGSPVIHPVRILEDNGLGSEIHNLDDQGKLLQYWAWAQMPLDVGVIFPSKDGRTY